MLQAWRKLSGRTLGLILIFLTAIIWVAASFVSQLLVTQQEGRPAFNVPPFLLTYLSTSIFTVFLPLVQLKALLHETWANRRSFRYKPLQEDQADEFEAAGAGAAGAAAARHHPHSSMRRSSSDGGNTAGGGGGGLSADLDAAEAAMAAHAVSAAARASRAAHTEALSAAAQCFVLWFAAQWLFNQSLQLTSVTSNTILSSASSLFTFALSMAFLKEPYSAAKLLAIGACIGGTLLVTLSDDAAITGGGSNSNSATSSSSNSSSSSTGSSITSFGGPGSGGGAGTGGSGSGGGGGGAGGPAHSVWGDLLCLVSAGCYAGYTIVLRRALPDEEDANVALFFGYVGLLCSVVFAPVVALAAGLGALHLRTIPPQAYAIILVQGILNYCISDYLWAHAVLLLGPTVATLGLSVQIPLAAGVEAATGHPHWLSSSASLAMTLAGTALIMAGFVAGNLATPGSEPPPGSHHRGGSIDGPTADQRHHHHNQQQQQQRWRPHGLHTHEGDEWRGPDGGQAGLHPSTSPEGPAPHRPPGTLVVGARHPQGTSPRAAHGPGSKLTAAAAAGGSGPSIPVSTHARVRVSSHAGGHRRSSSPSSSPRAAAGRSPTWQQQQQHQLGAAHDVGVELSSSSTPRSGTDGQVGGSSPMQQQQQQQQQQQGTGSPLRRQALAATNGAAAG